MPGNIKNIYAYEIAFSTHFFMSTTTYRLAFVTSLTLSCKVTIVWFKTGLSDLYIDGSQHTRRSTFLPTHQIQPSSRNLNNFSREVGAESSATQGGQCLGGMGMSPWSVRMDLWPSK